MYPCNNWHFQTPTKTVKTGMFKNSCKNLVKYILGIENISKSLVY